MFQPAVPSPRAGATRTSRSPHTIGALAAAFGLLAVAPVANAATLDTSVAISGQGSTFVSNFVEQCKVDSQKAFGINVAYQATGSGAGRTAYLDGTNDFGASDVAFTVDEAKKAAKKPFVYVPVTIGGVAVIHNVVGVKDLKLSGPTLAGIFAGKIQRWDDPAVVKENPGVSLPKQVIRVVVRSDSSGTSKVFSEYLAAAGGGAWKKGATSNFPAPAGNGIAQKGSDGVGNYVKGSQGKYSITYAEVSFATERKLPTVKVINASGKAVGPDPAAVTAALAAAAPNADGTLALNYTASGAGVYPISTTAYVIAPQKLDAKKGDVLRTFLTHAVTSCQKSAAKLGYAPLPPNVAKQALDAIAKINPGAAPVPMKP
jgi:phosphate transport system substrate-binding protein